MKPKVLLYNTFSFHLECFGLFFELFKENYDIDVFYRIDKYKWFDFYQKKFKFNRILQKNINVHNYKFIILITSNDKLIPQLLPITNKHICLMHVNGKNKYKINNHIYLTKYIKPETDNIFYPTPLYRLFDNTGNYTNAIVYIGQTVKNEIDNDMINFIKSLPEYNFIFIGYVIDGNNKISKLKNVIIKQKLDTPNMMKIIKTAKYIMPCKLPYQHTDRFTGAYNLALSWAKPILIQKEINERYKFPAIEFNKEYCELTNIIKSIDSNKYNKLQDELFSYCNKCLEKNKENLKVFLSKINKKCQ